VILLMKALLLLASVLWHGHAAQLTGALLMHASRGQKCCRRAALYVECVKVLDAVTPNLNPTPEPYTLLIHKLPTGKHATRSYFLMVQPARPLAQVTSPPAYQPQ
jgi:hypothetical protein